MPHISNRKQGVPNADKVKHRELCQELSTTTRSLSAEDKLKKLEEAVLWLLKHYE